MNRNAILDALVQYLIPAWPWRQFGRVVPYWDDVPADKQPAMFLRSTGEMTPERPTGQRPRTTLRAEIWVYAKVDERTGPKAAPSGASGRQLEAILDAIDARLSPPGQRGPLTLNGLAFHAWIEGETLKDTDSPDLQAVARIPIRILVP